MFLSILKGWFCAILVLNNILTIIAFNIDAFNYAVYGSTNDESMFGFSVAIHKQGYDRGWVLVGAPEAQSRYQPQNVRFGGVVFKCRPDGDDSCEEIPFDREGNQYFGVRELDRKSGQWFGATLSTSANENGGGPVVACAPRYVWYSKEMNRRDPVGTCFVADSLFEKFEEYSPCRTSNWGYHRQGSCQAGFSAAINSHGDRLFVGAPGSYYWQGQMYSIDAHASFNYTPGLLGTTYGAKGSVHQQSLENRPAVFQTREGQQTDDDSYLGYSTIIGDFLGNNEQGIAVGMPRGAELRGKVLLFTWNLTNYKNISSSQMGSYFGYSLAAGDIDGDKKLDLIVGAPMHTESNTEGKYDVGRVYVFYQGGGYGSFNKTSFLDGFNSKSRFGHSVAFLGDMNQDGYDDFAVGAPYDGLFNRGAVYIFYGSSKGVLEKYGQVIYAEDMSTRNGLVPVNTFGFAINGGLDMDGNDYPDMVVGAYLSNSAFFFRSRPVVRVESFVRFRAEGKQIDIKKKNCNLPNGQRVTCTTIDFCIKYSGKGIPQQIKLHVQYILDTKKPNIPRMAFLRSNSHTMNQTITLYKDSQDTCQTEEIYIKNDIRDKLTPLEAEVKYVMIDEDRSSFEYGRVSRNPQSQLKPVLDLNLPPSRKDSISIQKNCGHDNICIPNLHVNITKNVEKYLLDSNTNIEFDIIVSNLGEDSFETTLDLIYPEGVYYSKKEVKDDIHGILCSSGENRTISCDIGNPLPANKITKFTMIFSPYSKEGLPPTYEFDIRVNSTNPERNETLEDNFSHISIDIWVNSALDVSGRSIPQEVYISNFTQYTSEKIDKESEIGPQVTHLYTIRNEGPAPIYGAEMYILWPWQTLAGDDLLYLLEQPHVPEGVTCEIPAPANYKNYQLDYNSKPIWKRLQIDASSHDLTSSDGQHVQTESGKSIPGITGGGKVSGHKKLDQEISKTSGDSSIVNAQRQNQISEIERNISSTGNIQAGQTVYTKSEWHTSMENGKEVTKWTNVTTVKDASGKIVKTYYSTDDTDNNAGRTKNTDSFGQRTGAQQQSKPKIIYTSSGGGASSGSVVGEENLSITGRGEFQHKNDEEEETERKTITNQQQAQHVNNEDRYRQEFAYTVGGGPREGQISTTSSYEEIESSRRIAEEERIRFEAEERRKYEFQKKQEKEEDEKRRREESIRLLAEEKSRQLAYEEQIKRKQEEDARAKQKQQQDVQLKAREDQNRLRQEAELNKRKQAEEETRRRNDEEIIRRKQEEDYRIRQQQQNRPNNDNVQRNRQQEEERRRLLVERTRQEEEYRNRQSSSNYGRNWQQQEEDRRKLEEERRRLEDEEYRRKQEHEVHPTPNLIINREEEERVRLEEERIRQESEQRYRQEMEHRKLYEIEERRRNEEDIRRNKQWSERGGRTKTGYFDAQGVYHDETGSVTTDRDGNVIYNHTWTSEGTATIDNNDDRNNHQGGQINFGQAAASGNGFRTQTIDLGLDGLSGRSGGSSVGAGAGGRNEWIQTSQKSKGGSFSGTLEGGISEHDQYSSEWQRRRWQDASASPSFRDNVPTTSPDFNNRHRGRRQAPPIDPSIDEVLKCTSTKCFYVKCTVGTLKKDEFVSIALRSRLNVRAVRQLSTTQPVKLSSLMVARISELPYIGKPKDQVLHSHEIFTDIPAGEQELEPQVVPLWIILLSAIAGTLILLLVILLLYKCGFFKRKRPSTAPERQPLRTNGYHGD